MNRADVEAALILGMEDLDQYVVRDMAKMLAPRVARAIEAAGGCDVCGRFGVHGCSDTRERDFNRPKRREAALKVLRDIL